MGVYGQMYVLIVSSAVNKFYNSRRIKMVFDKVWMIHRNTCPFGNIVNYAYLHLFTYSDIYR